MFENRFIILQEWNSEREVKFEDSLHVAGQSIPDPNMTVKTSEGCSIPLGNIVQNTMLDSNRRWWHNSYSEYVVAKEDNIMLRYIIKFGDGSRVYSRKDFYMKDGDDGINGHEELDNSGQDNVSNQSDSESDIDSD